VPDDTSQSLHIPRQGATASAQPGLLSGLSTRLLGLTILFVLLVEAIIFLPSAANFRASWIETRVDQARLAVLALDAAPMREVSDDLATALLMRAEVVSVVEVREGLRQQLLSQEELPEGPVVISPTNRLRTFEGIGRTLGTLFGDGQRMLLIVDPDISGDHLEILVPCAPLKSALIGFTLRIVALSLVIAIAVGGLIFAALYLMVVRPILGITSAVTQFRNNPHDWTRLTYPTTRRDEIGQAQNALADMETSVQMALRQRERLAQLGEAMAKINHDLRNSLAAAQLVTDTLASSDDPRVRRTAPRLQRALERATGLAQATLDFGRGQPPAADIQRHVLKPVVVEAAQEGALSAGDTTLRFDIDPSITVQADAEALHRIIANLCRNAVQAMAARNDPSAPPTLRLHASPSDDGQIALDVSDNGPGIPERVRQRLFQPFAVSTNPSGSGLGLAIARELARGMGADLSLIDTGPQGTRFRITLPTG
jgi:hypothetical protein